VPGAAREVAPRSAATRLAWALCLSILLATSALALAAFNGLNLLELITDHHAIGIMDALVLAPIGALIVVGDRRHLLAWLLLVDGVVLAPSTSPSSTHPWPSGSPRGGCRCGCVPRPPTRPRRRRRHGPERPRLAGRAVRLTVVSRAGVVSEGTFHPPGAR
jgi:hypothetical protein